MTGSTPLRASRNELLRKLNEHSGSLDYHPSVTKMVLPNDSWNAGLESLLRSVVERVLRTESPRILLTRGGSDDWVPQPLLLPRAEIVELSGGISFVEELEAHLREQRPHDSLLLLPPLVNRHSLPRDFRRRYPRRALHEVALGRVLALVPVGTCVAAVLPVPLFTSEISRSLREELQRHLSVVIEHRHTWPNVHRSFRMHMAVFEKACDDRESTDSPLRFFRIPAEVEDEDRSLAVDVDSDLADLLARKGGRTRWGFVLREGLPIGEPWVYDLYSPQSVALQKDLRELGELRPLAELAEFPRTIHPVIRRDLLVDPDSEEGVPLLAGRDITITGDVLWDQTRHKTRESEASLMSGDICLRGIWNPTAQLVSAQIPRGAPPLAAANTLIVLRKKEETTEEEWQVLRNFLQSARAADLMAPRAMGSIHLNRRALGELPVPVPDKALRVALRRLTEAEADFESWRAETERQKRGLFGYSASQEGRIHLMQAGKRARQRQRAGRAVESLAFRIRTQYPYPLAYRWRMVEARAKRLEDYQNVLECAESTICYLALLAIVGARIVGTDIGQLVEICRRLVERGSGIGLGDWIAVLREVEKSKRFRDLKHFPFPEVLTVLADKDTNDAVQRLQEARNDHAHGRGPKGEAIAEAIEVRYADLEVLLESSEFLVEYPLRLIEETKRDSLSGRTQIHYRHLMGDHPLVPLNSDDQESSEIEADSVYVLDRLGSYHLARPWLSWRTCQTCQRPATFHVERYNSKNDSVTLKSLEHGHTMDDKSLGSAFRKLGFLT